MSLMVKFEFVAGVAPPPPLPLPDAPDAAAAAEEDPAAEPAPSTVANGTTFRTNVVFCTRFGTGMLHAVSSSQAGDDDAEDQGCDPGEN